MDTSMILAELRAERDRIDRAIVAIGVLNSTATQRGWRPAAVFPSKKRARRRMSAATRRKMSRMMKQRWVEAKKRGKAAL